MLRLNMLALGIETLRIPKLPPPLILLWDHIFEKWSKAEGGLEGVQVVGSYLFFILIFPLPNSYVIIPKKVFFSVHV